MGSIMIPALTSIITILQVKIYVVTPLKNEKSRLKMFFKVIKNEMRHRKKGVLKGSLAFQHFNFVNSWFRFLILRIGYTSTTGM